MYCCNRCVVLMLRLRLRQVLTYALVGESTKYVLRRLGFYFTHYSARAHWVHRGLQELLDIDVHTKEAGGTVGTKRPKPFDSRWQALRRMLLGLRQPEDLEARAANVLLRQALYRRWWVALLLDEDLLKYSCMGPRVLKQIRRRIPYAGPPEGAHADTMLCPVCHGTGLMSGAERAKRGQ